MDKWVQRWEFLKWSDNIVVNTLVIGMFVWIILALLAARAKADAVVNFFDRIFCVGFLLLAIWLIWRTCFAWSDL